VSVRKVEKFEK